MAGISSYAAHVAPLSPPPDPFGAEGHGGAAAAADAADAADDDNTFSPLLDLLERFPDLFAQKVLQHLDPIDRTFLAQAGSACRAAVASSDLPRAGTREEVLEGKSVWVVTHNVREFCTSVERLAWAKASGCPWVQRTCALRRSGRAPGGAEVGAGARLPVGHGDGLLHRLAGWALEVMRCWALKHGCPWGKLDV